MAYPLTLIREVLEEILYLVEFVDESLRLEAPVIECLANEGPLLSVHEYVGVQHLHLIHAPVHVPPLRLALLVDELSLALVWSSLWEEQRHLLPLHSAVLGMFLRSF